MKHLSKLKEIREDTKEMRFEKYTQKNNLLGCELIVSFKIYHYLLQKLCKTGGLI